MTRAQLVMLVCTAALIEASRAQATALDTIERAMTAEQHSVHKQSHLTFMRNGAVVVTDVEINQPDQMHMVRTMTGHKIEVYAVKTAAYWRLDAGSWHQTATTGKPLPQPPQPPIKYLLAGMTNVIELPTGKVGAVAARRFRSNISWSAGAQANEGIVTLVVRKANLLPLSMTFKGECDHQTCEFEQKFSYQSDIVIKSPVSGG
jgi:hypothetical protein